MFFDSIGEAFERKNRLNGYVHESMFFNPVSERSSYKVREGDLLLVTIETSGRCGWMKATDEVGQVYKELIQERKSIKSIATPMVFEFSDDGIHSAGAYFNWGAMGMGFGQMSFHLDKEVGKVRFDTEMMGPETTRRMLHQFVDYIVDNGVSDDWDRRARDEAEENDE